MDYYRIVTLTEDDLALIKGGPEVRAHFLLIRQLCSIILILCDSVNNVKHIVENRNALIQTRRHHYDSYHIWTEQFWQNTQQIQERVLQMLEQLEQEVRELDSRLF